jgi:streptogrisin C
MRSSNRVEPSTSVNTIVTVPEGSSVILSVSLARTRSFVTALRCNDCQHGYTDSVCAANDIEPRPRQAPFSRTTPVVHKKKEPTMTRTTTTQQPTEASRRRTKGRSIRACLILAVLLAAAIATLSANAAGGKPVDPPAISSSTPDPAADRGPSNIDPDAAAAMASQKGISIAEAKARLGRQKELGAQGAWIEMSLAGHSGGTYLDTDGNLVVTTLDASSDTVVTRNGARAQRVDDSSARLDAIMEQLNRQASSGRGGAVQGWYVDVPTNTVVVTVTEGAIDSNTVAMTKLATSFGDSVRIEYRPADQAPQPAQYLVGGFEFLLPDGAHVCSVGFNTVDAFNRNVVLTAGHCVKSSGTVSRDGYWIGSTRTADFPTDDFGTFWNSYPSYWQPSKSVYLYNGTYATVAGQWDNPPVGATVCKSGRTTGFTCGTIKALNQTVVYPEGTVYGLVRHTACVEGGDSGGANISAGYYALGVTSGASTPVDTGKCLSKSGGTNISWYQPVGEALSRNGLQLVR